MFDGCRAYCVEIYLRILVVIHFSYQGANYTIESFHLILHIYKQKILTWNHPVLYKDLVPVAIHPLKRRRKQNAMKSRQNVMIEYLGLGTLTLSSEKTRS